MIKDSFSAVAASYRAEGEKAKYRAIAFAVILVMVHLLEIRPSELDALGLKVSLKDPAVLYGFISLVFGYYLSKYIDQNDKGESLSPLSVAPRRIRYSLIAMRRINQKQDKKTRDQQTPKKLKGQARNMLRLGNVILIPYRLISTLFVLAAMCFAVSDIWHITYLVWATSKTIQEITEPFRNI